MLDNFPGVRGNYGGPQETRKHSHTQRTHSLHNTFFSKSTASTLERVQTQLKASEGFGLLPPGGLITTKKKVWLVFCGSLEPLP